MYEKSRESDLKKINSYVRKVGVTHCDPAYVAPVQGAQPLNSQLNHYERQHVVRYWKGGVQQKKHTLQELDKKEKPKVQRKRITPKTKVKRVRL